MKASVVDLRYKMKKVMQALRRRETVEILYHGKPAGLILPIGRSKPKKDFRNHAFFGMHRKKGLHAKSVEKVMDELRGGRYRAL